MCGWCPCTFTEPDTDKAVRVDSGRHLRFWVGDMDLLRVQIEATLARPVLKRKKRKKKAMKKSGAVVADNLGLEALSDLGLDEVVAEGPTMPSAAAPMPSEVSCGGTDEVIANEEGGGE